MELALHLWLIFLFQRELGNWIFFLFWVQSVLFLWINFLGFGDSLGGEVQCLRTWPFCAVSGMRREWFAYKLKWNILNSGFVDKEVLNSRLFGWWWGRGFSHLFKSVINIFIGKPQFWACLNLCVHNRILIYFVREW